MKFIFKLFLIIVLSASLIICSVTGTNAVSTSAKAFVLINADTLEVLAGENINTKLSMASTTKIMTALLLAEQNTPDKEIVTTKEMVTVEGSSMGLQIGDTVSYYELIVGMMLASGNDAANTAAIAVSGSVSKFADLMNKRAQEIGMKNTNFVTPSGLDDEMHYSTAYDMALLAAVALNNKTVAEICSKKSITVSYGNPPYQRTLYNHNRLLKEYEYCIGVKTGFTKKSGRCLVSAAERNGCRVIAVTLKDPNDWSDHKVMLEYGLECLSQQDVTADLSSYSVPVVGGEVDKIYVTAPKFLCGCSSMSQSKLESKITIKPFVYAPISLNSAVGTVEYIYDGRVIHKDEIVTINSVSEKIIVEKFSDKFKRKIIQLLMCNL